MRVSIFLYTHHLLLDGLPIQLLNPRTKICMTKEWQSQDAEEERNKKIHQDGSSVFIGTDLQQSIAVNRRNQMPA
jgi:hypothetical protein